VKGAIALKELAGSMAKENAPAAGANDADAAPKPMSKQQKTRCKQQVQKHLDKAANGLTRLDPSTAESIVKEHPLRSFVQSLSPANDASNAAAASNLSVDVKRELADRIGVEISNPIETIAHLLKSQCEMFKSLSPGRHERLMIGTTFSAVMSYKCMKELLECGNDFIAKCNSTNAAGAKSGMPIGVFDTSKQYPTIHRDRKSPATKEKYSDERANATELFYQYSCACPKFSRGTAGYHTTIVHRGSKSIRELFAIYKHSHDGKPPIKESSFYACKPANWCGPEMRTCVCEICKRFDATMKDIHTTVDQCARNDPSAKEQWKDVKSQLQSLQRHIANEISYLSFHNAHKVPLGLAYFQPDDESKLLIGLTANQLELQCTKRHIPKSGTKDRLVRRIRVHDLRMGLGTCDECNDRVRAFDDIKQLIERKESKNHTDTTLPRKFEGTAKGGGGRGGVEGG
jgi:hypothetical protein